MEKDKIIIFGNSSMAKVLYSYARKSFDVCGFTVDDFCIKDGEKEFCALPLVPFSKVTEKFSPKEYKMIFAIGFIDMNELREKKSEAAKAKGYEFVSYVDKSVQMHDGVEIEENCVILDFVSIHPGAKIKTGTFISGNVNLGHDCIVEPYNWINAGVSMAGGCKIGKGCFFGVNSCVAHEVKLGERNFVAAGVVINKDTKDDEVYLAEPSQRFRLNSKKFLKFANV